LNTQTDRTQNDTDASKLLQELNLTAGSNTGHPITLYI